MKDEPGLLATRSDVATEICMDVCARVRRMLLRKANNPWFLSSATYPKGLGEDNLSSENHLVQGNRWCSWSLASVATLISGEDVHRTPAIEKEFSWTVELVC